MQIKAHGLVDSQENSEVKRAGRKHRSEKGHFVEKYGGGEYNEMSVRKWKKLK